MSEKEVLSANMFVRKGLEDLIREFFGYSSLDERSEQRVAKVSAEIVEMMDRVRGVAPATRSWEAWEESQRAAKAEWGEAVEETDKTRAFRVLTILNDFPRDRAAQEKRLAEEFAEVRAVGASQCARVADVLKVDPPNRTFLDELEKHRSRINVHQATGSAAQNDVLEALWFLLAVAHQP